MSGKPKLKAKPDWDGDGTTDRYAKFRAKGVRWEPIEGEDRLHIDEDVLRDLERDGLRVQWVTHTVLGKEFPYEFSKFERGGWTRVAAGDIDGIDTTEIDGLLLMARPVAIDDKAREYEQRKAREQVRTKEAAWKGGELSRSVTLDSRHPSALRTNKINRTYERIDIPGDGD